VAELSGDALYRRQAQARINCPQMFRKCPLGYYASEARKLNIAGMLAAGVMKDVVMLGGYQELAGIL
jgi:hypothetical protein